MFMLKRVFLIEGATRVDTGMSTWPDIPNNAFLRAYLGTVSAFKPLLTLFNTV